MKTIRLKKAMVSSIATMMLVAGFGTSVNAQATSKVSTNLQREKAVINKDLACIEKRQQRVQALSDKWEQDRKAGTATSATRCELMKAQADLQKDKAYLKADKSEFLKAHQAFIGERRAEVKEERAQLMSSEKSLRAELAKGNPDAVLYTQQIVNQKHQLAQNQTALKQEKISRSDDLMATNQKIREAKAESPVLLAFEDQAAADQNNMLK